MPGLGLGLTITRLLTNTLGGEISVSSEKDQGTDLPRSAHAVGRACAQMTVTAAGEEDRQL